MFHYNRFHPRFVVQNDSTARHANDDPHFTSLIVAAVKPVLLHARQLRRLDGSTKVELGSVCREVLVLGP